MEKFNKATLDRIVRPYLRNLTDGIKQSMSRQGYEFAAIEFLHETENARWQDLETSRDYIGMFLLHVPGHRGASSVYWHGGKLYSYAGRPISIVEGMMWREIPTYSGPR